MSGKKGRSGRPELPAEFKKVSASFSLSRHTINLLHAELKRLGWHRCERNKYVDFVLSRTLLDPKKRVLIQLEMREREVNDSKLLLSQLQRREKLEQTGSLE